MDTVAPPDDCRPANCRPSCACQPRLTCGKGSWLLSHDARSDVHCSDSRVRPSMVHFSRLPKATQAGSAIADMTL